MNELEVTNDFIEELNQIEELQTTLAVSDMERMSGIWRRTINNSMLLISNKWCLQVKLLGTVFLFGDFL